MSTYLHILLCAKAPFIVDPEVLDNFEFRVLRENRRAVGDSAELEEFHKVLADVSWGEATPRVRKFIIDAYVRGASIGCADHASLEGNTGVFTKRRYRDKWNRTMVRRIAKVHSHSLKIKGKCRARGTRGHNWYSDSKLQYIRRRVRTQALWNLHLAGDWHAASGTVAAPRQPHLMRVMLVSNLAVDQRFANGTQGRLLYWYPSSVLDKKALPASHPELLARFAKESAMHKREMFPDIDHIDVTARQETLAVRGEPVLLQLPLNPCYALTIHKTQALSIAHLVLGCLEGVFALGQIYVLFSRVTIPFNCQLVGIPPIDMIDEIADALRAAGLDVDKCFKRAAAVTGEWEYAPGGGPVSARITQKRVAERTIPLKHRTLAEVLNPQPQASAVIRNLLDWIDRVDSASQHGSPRPLFSTNEGERIFPPDPWWLTELRKRTDLEEEPEPGDEDGPPSDKEGQVDEAALTDDDDPPSCDEGLDTEKVLAHEPILGWNVPQAAACIPTAPVLPLANRCASSCSSIGSCEANRASGGAASSSSAGV